MISDTPTMSIPLRRDDTGAIRIGDTRILLEIVIRAFLNGETPESIVDSYSTLNTSDVYAVIAYYLNHRVEIDTYIRERDEQVEAIFQSIDDNRSVSARDLRTRLRAFKEKSG